jgi:hypothetical protein
MHSTAGVKLAHLKKIPESPPAATPRTQLRMHGREAQDTPLPAASRWRRRRLPLALAACAVPLVLLAWAVHGWLGTGQLLARERLRLAEVTRGHFVRDVAADGTVVAAVNPTLFAIAPVEAHGGRRAAARWLLCGCLDEARAGVLSRA